MIIPRGLTIEKIKDDPAMLANVITVTNTRMKESSSYYADKLDKMIKCWKVYRQIKDGADDSDEPNSGPGYAYGLIEDGVAAISESILNARVPTPARARHAKDQEAAENFNAVAGAYFSSGQYQEDYPNSVRERLVIGSNYEFDGWAWDFAHGKRNAKVPRTDEKGVDYLATEEVDQDHPLRVGYYTRFPSTLLIRPQPRVIKVEQMDWLIEIEERVSLADLEAKIYVDPVTKEKKPFFDLSEIKKAKEGGAIIRPMDVTQLGSDYQQQYMQIMDGQAKPNVDDMSGTVDQLTLEWNWEKDRVWCVANGMWVICYIEDLYHRPGIPYRLKRCTPQPHSLYGLGFIEPVINQLYDLDDVRILSKRNWIRIINRMIAYNPDSVPYAEADFKPKAMGRIRVRPQLGRSVASEIHEINHEDVTSSMMAQESATKGDIQSALGIQAFTAGISGSQQSSKVLGIQDQIAAKAATRVSSVRRQELAGFQKQLWRMEGLYSQFLFEKQPFTIYGPDGSTSIREINLWDLDTQGRGLDFIIEYDPAMGNDSLMRNQLMQFMGQCNEYNMAAAQMDPSGQKIPRAQIQEVMRRTAKAFGFTDTSTVLAMMSGEKTPEEELNLMLQGQPVMPTPAENLIEHLAAHTMQAQNPQLHEAIAKGAVHPDVLLRLKSHIEVTRKAIAMSLQAAQNPRPMPGAPGGPGGPGDAAAPGVGVQMPNNDPRRNMARPGPQARMGPGGRQ